MIEITAATRLFALLGNPVSHSLSPHFQNAAIRAAGLDAVYVALRVASEAVRSMMRTLADAGGGGNVTIPHKATAAAALTRASEAVRRTNACNTFWMEKGELYGDNTDVVGFVRAAESLLDSSLAGSRILLLGAGGTAGAVAYGCVRSGCDEVTIINRSPDKADRLIERYSSDSCRFLRKTLADVGEERFDLVVNATSLGLRPDDPLPLSPDSPIRYEAALDLVYASQRTRWVRQLRAAGHAAEDGLEMLIHQGAAAFEHWFAMTPDYQVMRAALPPRS